MLIYANHALEDNVQTPLHEGPCDHRYQILTSGYFTSQMTMSGDCQLA